MKRIDYRILIGVALVLGGILMLLDQTGLLKGATDYFWAGIFAIGAAIFLSWFYRDTSRWWAAIPGFALAGIAVSSFFHNLPGLGGLFVLGGIGAGFWAIYFANRQRWWAILPGGILVTLGASSVITSYYGEFNGAGIFFLGLGITFLLVGLLVKMRWAYIPAAVLLLLGFFFGLPFGGVMAYFWIAALLVAGGILIFVAVKR